MPPKKKGIVEASERDSYRQRLDETARSATLQTYYNSSVGQHDEVKAGSRDKHGNRSGHDADLGRVGAFSEFKLLFGEFLGVIPLASPQKALEDKGFQVKVVTKESEFLDLLDWCDAAAVISGSTPDKKKLTGSKEFYPAWKDATKEKFVAECTAARASGKGFWVWADNDPLFEQANALLDEWFGFKLEGNTQANKILKLGMGRGGELKKGEFRRHTITSGIEKLYEGVTICHPPQKGDTAPEEMEVLAVSTDGWPCSLCRDNVDENDENGRVLVDCGWTKLFSQWDDAGTARYVVNGFVWLLALEHKELRRAIGSTGSSGPSSGAATATASPPLAEQHEFIDAAKKHDFTKVRQMVEKCPGLVNVQPAGRWSALHQAAEAGDAGAVSFLLEHGADLGLLTKDGKTPKDVAHKEVVALLAKKPAKNKAPPVAEQHEFIDAAKNRDFIKVRQMVEKSLGIVNVQPSGRWSALHQAAEAGDVGAVTFLLEHDADISLETKDGKTPKDVADPKFVTLLTGQPPKKKAKKE